MFLVLPTLWHISIMALIWRQWRWRLLRLLLLLLWLCRDIGLWATGS